MALDKKRQIVLLKIVDEGLELLTQLASEFLASRNHGTMEQETAYLTAAEAIKRETRKNTLRDFLQRLENSAHSEPNKNNG